MIEPPAPDGSTGSCCWIRVHRGLSPGGCDFAEAVDTQATDARLFWHEELDAAVLLAVARPPTAHNTGFDVRSLSNLATILCDTTFERLSLSDGYHHLRIDIASGSLLRGPVTLRFLIDDDARAPAKLTEILRFRALRSRGSFAKWLEPALPQRRRWVLQLRALDAVNAGATTREIASALFPIRAAREDWRNDGESVRSSIRRLIANARRMSEVGYRAILSRD